MAGRGGRCLHSILRFSSCALKTEHGDNAKQSGRSHYLNATPYLHQVKCLCPIGYFVTGVLAYAPFVTLWREHGSWKPQQAPPRPHPRHTCYRWWKAEKEDVVKVATRWRGGLFLQNYSRGISVKTAGKGEPSFSGSAWLGYGLVLSKSSLSRLGTCLAGPSEELSEPCDIFPAAWTSSGCHRDFSPFLILAWGFIASRVWRQKGEARVCPFRISLLLPAWLQFSSFRFWSSTLRCLGDVFYLVWKFLKSVTVWNWYYKQNTSWSRDKKTLSVKRAWSRTSCFSTFERASTSNPTTL